MHQFNPAALFGKMDYRGIELEDGTVVISVTGNYGIMADGLKRLLDAKAAKPFAMYGAGIREDGQQVHLLLIDASEVKKAIVQRTEDTAKLKLDGYKYLDGITTLRGKKNAFVLEAGISAKVAAKPLGAIAKATLKGAKVRGSETGTRTMILSGRQGAERQLFVTKAGEQTIKLDMPKGIETPRFTFVDGHTVLAAESGTERIAALNEQWIDQMFESDVTPEWEVALLSELEVQELSVEIGNTPTIAVTGNYKGKSSYVFATVRWDKDAAGRYNGFKLQVHAESAVEIDQVSDGSAIQRVTPDVMATTDFKNGTLIHLGQTERFGAGAPAKATFDANVQKAWQGGYAQQIAA